MIDVVVVTGAVDISGANVRMNSIELFETIDKGMGITRVSGEYRATNNASQTGASFAGFALQAGVSGDWITSVRGGYMTFGPGLIESGAIYGVSTGNGAFGDITGLGTNDWVSQVGYGISDDVLFVNSVVTNTQRQ